MTPVELVKLAALMERTSGRAEIKVGLIDGPVLLDHPGLDAARCQELSGALGSRCVRASSLACAHGTFVAGILFGKRGSAAPAICPGCTLLLRPIFAEGHSASERPPEATHRDLAAAITDCVNAGAHAVNLSLALAWPSARGRREVEAALDYAARQGVLVVAAAPPSWTPKPLLDP